MGNSRLRRLRVFGIDRGGLLALVALIAYVWLAPAHIVDGDNAEFATLGTIGGTAHPTGYPLYLLWLRLMAWLPGLTPAHTTALATAILSAAMVGVLHAACRAWGARPLGATIAVAIFAAAPIFVRIASTAEVFALNCLVVSAVLWIAATGGPLRGAWRGITLGLIAGLGISDHVTCVLVAPVGILGAMRAARESSLPRPATIALATLGLAVGLLPYGYLLATSDTPLSWGKIATIDDLVGMITRRDYGGPGAFMPRNAVEVSAVNQLAALSLSLGRTWLWAPLAFGLFTLARRIARSGDGETRWGFAMLAISWLAAGPLLASRFDIEPAGLGLYLVQRFHVLAAMMLAIPVAIGLAALEPLVVRIRDGSHWVCGLVATLGFAAALSTTLPLLLRVHTPAVEQYARNLLQMVPPNSVLFLSQDDQYFGTGYVQWALGERQDVVVVAPQMTGMAWYSARIARRGIAAPPGDGLPIIRLVDQLTAAGRPVFVERSRPEVLAAFPTHPFGPVVKVLPRGAKLPPIEDVVRENAAIYERFELGYARPGPDDEFATAIHHRYAATWKVLGHTLESAGRHEEAERAFEVARAVGPRP